MSLGQNPITKRTAYTFIILLGLISLFSDTVYEGARSVTGPFLGLLGANGVIIGTIAGLGELISFVLRSYSGYLVDKTGRYWSLASIGYLLNIIAIPALAFVTTWQVAATLIILERIGKALRMPARDAMLSYASQKVGRGRGFGLHQLLDQMGGMLGPLMITLVLLYEHNYNLALGLLFIPAAFTFILLNYTQHRFTSPASFETEEPQQVSKKGLPGPFWIYMVSLALFAAGFVDFPLIAYHFHKVNVFEPIWIPMIYVLAMGASALSAFFSGWLYDKMGSHVLVAAMFISALFPLAVFFGDLYVSIVGMVCWASASVHNERS